MTKKCEKMETDKELNENMKECIRDYKKDIKEIFDEKKVFCAGCKKHLKKISDIKNFMYFNGACYCQKCGFEHEKQHMGEISRAFGEVFSEEDTEDEIGDIKKRLLKLEKEVKRLKNKR